MKTKLTLNIDEAVVRKARVLSKRRKRSISAIVEDYLQKATTAGNKQNAAADKSFTQQFREKFTAKNTTTAISYKEQRHKHLDQKYGS